jgi:hypothetical protein
MVLPTSQPSSYPVLSTGPAKGLSQPPRAGGASARGPEAVRELNRHGFRARRLIDGFPEWKRAGLPVAVPAGAGRS